MNRIKKVIIHPFFFAVYPVLSLLAHNLGESRISIGTRAFIVSLVFAFLILLVYYLFNRNWYRAAIHCTFTLLLIFTYGQFYSVIESRSLLGLSLGRHRVLLPIYFGIFVFGTWWIARKIRNLSTFTELLNIISIVAFIFPIIQIVFFQINSSRMWRNDTRKIPDEAGTLQTSEIEVLPDVYYIVLDAYARGDTMQEFYGFDNEPFLNQLEEMGFLIAGCSQSNYAKTRLSLASTLNMDYLENFEEISQDLERNKENRIRMGKLIRQNAVRDLFKAFGYDIVAFETGYLWSEWDNADIYLAQESVSSFENIQLFGTINSFEALLIKTSIGLFFLDAESVLSSAVAPAVRSPRRAHYEYILYTLDTIESAASIDSPKFVFAHLISPHGPYVFTADGEFVPDENDTETGYIDQVQYLNSRLIPLLDNIIEQSEIPPIIILQADHGGHGTQFNQEQRMNILNAYYLPDVGGKNLYETISPVNTFRLIFDSYFGTDFGSLPDVSYYSSVENFFDFVVVPNQCIE